MSFHAEARLAKENERLRETNAGLHQEIERLRAELAEAQARIAELEKVLEWYGFDVDACAKFAHEVLGDA